MTTKKGARTSDDVKAVAAEAAAGGKRSRSKKGGPRPEDIAAECGFEALCKRGAWYIYDGAPPEPMTLVAGPLKRIEVIPWLAGYAFASGIGATVLDGFFAKKGGDQS